MTKIFYGSRVVLETKKTSPDIHTLLDTGAENCYVDLKLIKDIGLDIKKLKESTVGLGGKIRKRYGPVYPTFSVKFKKLYKGEGKTYITDLPGAIGVILSGNWIKEMKLPVHEIIEYEEHHEY